MIEHVCRITRNLIVEMNVWRGASLRKRATERKIIYLQGKFISLSSLRIQLIFNM
jgi:hypothetical protein